MEIFEIIQEISRNTKLFSTTMVYKCSSEKVNPFDTMTCGKYGTFTSWLM